jgi:hypothetical protein
VAVSVVVVAVSVAVVAVSAVSVAVVVVGSVAVGEVADETSVRGSWALATAAVRSTKRSASRNTLTVNAETGSPYRVLASTLASLTVLILGTWSRLRCFADTRSLDLVQKMRDSVR